MITVTAVSGCYITVTAVSGCYITVTAVNVCHDHCYKDKPISIPDMRAVPCTCTTSVIVSLSYIAFNIAISQ